MASPNDFETQISLRRLVSLAAVFSISPSKRVFKKYKPRGLFSEFYGNKKTKQNTSMLRLFNCFNFDDALPMCCRYTFLKLLKCLKKGLPTCSRHLWK